MRQPFCNDYGIRKGCHTCYKHGACIMFSTASPDYTDSCGGKNAAQQITSAICISFPILSTDRNERLRNFRLPGDLWPTYYDIEIQPYIYNDSEPFVFDGRISITFTCMRATDKVIINMKDFEPDQVRTNNWVGQK